MTFSPKAIRLANLIHSLNDSERVVRRGGGRLKDAA